MNLDHLPKFKTSLCSDLKSVKTVYLDIDDTVSTHGKLTSQAYQALWDLKNAGFGVVPVTGRPAGWCDHIARFWPVDGVIGENGAFIFRVVQRKQQQSGQRKSSACQSKIQGPVTQFERHYTEYKPEFTRKKLNSLYTKIQKKFKGAKAASDQAYRQFDLAIDWCEDVKPWPKSKVQDLIEFCETQGAHVKLSSIHLNIWFGTFDKIFGIRHWIKLNKKNLKSFETDLFIGDSPNDAPAFAAFKKSVGVANLRKSSQDLKALPRWLTDAESGTGFVEMVDHFLNVRSRG